MKVSTTVVVMELSHLGRRDCFTTVLARERKYVERKVVLEILYVL
jgi:hypothetical protein